MSPSFLIGQSNYFGFGFHHSFENHSNNNNNHHHHHLNNNNNNNKNSTNDDDDNGNDNSDRASLIFKHLQNSEHCHASCSADCFRVFDHVSTSFQLKIKEAIHIQR